MQGRIMAFSTVLRVTAVMRTLQISDRPTKLAQAIAELGRIDERMRALTFIDDENKRRRTLIQLNRHEDRHKLARAVFHGLRGELRQGYREGRKTKSGHSDQWSTSSFCGIRFTSSQRCLGGRSWKTM